MSQLSEKQLKFAENYLISQNGKQSAIKAGYAKASAHVQANRLLKIDNVKKYIQKRLKSKVKKDIMGANNVLQRLTDIANTNIDKDEVRPSDVLNALEKLGKFHKLFTDVHEVSEADEYSELVARMRNNKAQSDT